MGKKSGKLTLHIVFDTNVLFTKLASDLFRSEIKALSERIRTITDLDIELHLPSVVIEERRFQMIEKAKEFLPTIGSLETLLGHRLNITEEILAMRVGAAIDTQLLTYQFNKLELDTSLVNWDGVISDAIKRMPPFENNKTEKGFRDALIAESFLQLLNKSPSTPSICRVAIVTGDELLTAKIGQETADKKNVHVLAGVDEIIGLINTLTSSIGTELAATLAGVAQNLFFQVENSETLYYKAKVAGQIDGKFSKELLDVPTPGWARQILKRWISAPNFEKKVGSRIHWSTPITFDLQFRKPGAARQLTLADLMKQVSTPPAQLGAAPPSSQSAGVNWLLPQTQFPTPPPWEDAGTGKQFFEVKWSTSLTKTHKLTNPRIDEVRFVKSDWRDLV